MRNEASPESVRPVIRPCRPSVHSLSEYYTLDIYTVVGFQNHLWILVLSKHLTNVFSRNFV
jgi:hypothetical protein